SSTATVYQYDNGLLNFLGIPQEQSPHIRLSGQSGKAPALHFRPRSVMAAGESYQMLSINRVGTEL
ncbi:hypothetical protein CUC39_02435, partial [Shigella boydii]